MKRNIIFYLIVWMLVLIVSMWGAKVGAESIPTLFSTGVDDNGVSLPPSTVDPHYTLVLSADSRFPGPAAIVSFSNPYWVPSGSNAKWISPNENFVSMASGIYIFRTTFDLTDFDPASAAITGRYSVDNAMVDIRLNGTSIGPVTPGDHYSFSSFTINRGFVEGINSIEFIMENGFIPSGINPTGLVVEMSGNANRVVQPPPGVERSFIEGSLTENLLTKSAVISNAVVSGDFVGMLNFTELEMVTITTGPFVGKGFSKGKWETTLEGTNYTGDWQGVIFDKAAERKIYLKGAVTGQISATVEGYLIESVPQSGIYDKYQATWKIGHVGTNVTSATINLDGVVSYQSSSEFPGSELYILQTNIEGNVYGDYTGALNTILTQINVVEENNPYYGQGFSIISYTSESGSGEGWTYDKVISPGVIKLKGLFGSPLFGIVSGTLDETITPRTLYVTVERIDLGLAPAPDLRVTTWGPTRVSPGQLMNLIIEFRNTGLKAADNAILFQNLDPDVAHVLSSQGGRYDDFYHAVAWDLGPVPPRSAQSLFVGVAVPWGLPGGAQLDTWAYTLDSQNPATEQVVQQISSVNPSSTIQVNLLGNGISTPVGSPKDKAMNKFAYMINAARIPGLYASGDGSRDAGDVQRATPDSNFPGFPYEANENNGLKYFEEMGKIRCNTAVGYSGSTRTFVTAILNGNLECDTLVLISPMSGITLFKFGDWKREIEQIRRQYPNMEIVIYQSKKDRLGSRWLNYLFQVHFGPSDIQWLKDNNIKVNPGTKEFAWDRNGDGVADPFEPVELNGKILKMDQEEINKQNHEGLFDHLLKILLDQSGTSSPRDESGISAVATTTIAAAHDPNIKYGPEGNVLPGQKLDYKVECSNEGEGIAFGVYFTDTLDKDLDDSTLEIGPVVDVKTGAQIAPPGIYNPSTRTITWLVGEVGPGEGGYTEFSVNVLNNATDGTEIINYATVHFPSVPESTRTNGIVNVVCLNPNNVWYKDIDNDGYSDEATLTQCLRPQGYKLESELISGSGDCDDNDPSVHPGAVEICDGKDNNCNGQIDEGVLNTYYRDEDGDGYGNPALSIQACAPPTGYVANNTDCDDNKAAINPATIWYKDADNDGYSDGITKTQCERPSGYKLLTELTATSVDCDDTKQGVHPGASEICGDGIDNNCNGQIDEGCVTSIKISGGAYFYPETATYRASFSMDVTGPTSPSGWLKYYYTRTRMNFVSTGITSASLSGNTATVSGTGTVNGAGSYTFTATVANGSPDTFGIVIKKLDGSTYYSAGPKNISGGDLVIR